MSDATTAPFVFSIRKQYGDLILAGSKRWEFRTRRPSVATGDTALIYESRGCNRIVASFVVGRVIEGEPIDVRGSVETVGHGGAGIGLVEYLEYFRGRSPRGRGARPTPAPSSSPTPGRPELSRASSCSCGSGPG